MICIDDIVIFLWFCLLYMKKLIRFLKKYETIYGILVYIYYLPKFLYYQFFLRAFAFFRIDNKKVIIINFAGKWYWDNGKYISNKLLKYKDLKIYWAAKKKEKGSLPKEIHYVRFDSIKYLYHLATAKIWINNSRFESGIIKRKGQFYIQTWHGCIVFKKVESAVIDKLPRKQVWDSKNDSKLADCFVSNSVFGTNFYKKYFWYDGDILEYWCPRNDVIVNNNKELIKKIKTNIKISDDEKICLYAPTFRANAWLGVYDIKYDLLIRELTNKFWWNWKVLIRLHPLISFLSKQLIGLNKNVINVTDYPDIQELLVVSDFLITDYSSCIFDYALSKKPAMIYASDIEEYKEDRDFEIKLEEQPFPIATNNMELKEVINNYDVGQYKSDLDKFYSNIGLKETGESSEIIAEIIREMTNNE